MPCTRRTLNDVFLLLPNGSSWACSFGNEGEGGFKEYWNAPNGDSFRLANGPYDALKPFIWTIEIQRKGESGYTPYTPEQDKGTAQ
jgi:hypothetical protein